MTGNQDWLRARHHGLLLVAIRRRDTESFEPTLLEIVEGRLIDHQLLSEELRDGGFGAIIASDPIRPS
jgi:hypothetical protein